MQEGEALLTSSSSREQQQIEQLKVIRKELEREKQSSKEEEEKRTKAVGLLKSVRQKLVKTEKERDDALKELGSLKAKEKVDVSRERKDRAQMEVQIQALKDANEKELRDLAKKFEDEEAIKLSNVKKEMLREREMLEDEQSRLKAYIFHRFYD